MKCLIVTCTKCKGLMAMAIDGDVVELGLSKANGTIAYSNRLLDLKFSMSDVAVVNKMPVCDCGDLKKELGL